MLGAYLRLFRSIGAALTGDADLLAANSRAAYRQAQHLPGIMITLLAAVPFGLDLGLQLRRVSPGDRQNGDGQPTPHAHDPRDEQPRNRDRDEQGEQWQHSEAREQALVSEASRRPGGAQHSTLTEPDDDSP